MKPLDLRSDTVTQPTTGMRQAMAHAHVGDDVYGEDPSVTQLERRAAELMGKERALFVPSGTMANLIAVRCHTQPGDAMLAGEGAHVYLYEGGGAAALAGVHSVIVGRGGLFDADELEAALYPSDAHFARPRLVCIENTHNRSGGRVFPQLDQLEIARTCRKLGLRLHLDGARIFNAACAQGTTPQALTLPFDSVSFCLSKGLGAPVGSLLCGSRELIDQAHRVRKMLGGGMRQAGVLAAAGSYALEHHVERLALDHANAAAFADGLARVPAVKAVRQPETNIVVFEVSDARDFVARAHERAIWVNALDSRHVRAVTHLDVDRGDIESGLERLMGISR